MTCEQGLLRLLWGGGPKLECYGTVHDRSSSNPTLKILNPSRLSGRYDAVYVLKERFSDNMKCFTHIILTSTKPKERDEAMAIKKQTENLNFVFMLVVQCKILEIVNIPSKAVQCKTIDLISAHKLLQKAAQNIAELRTSFDAVMNEASSISSQWGLPRQFSNKRTKKTKTFFDNYPKGSCEAILRNCLSSIDGHSFSSTY